MMALSIPEVFKHCPRCGSSAFNLSGKSLRVCGDCDFHYHFNPVCAAGAIISDPEGRVLLIERGHEPAKGKLGVPGGFTDLGETVEEALLREVQEEVGLKIFNLNYITSYTNDYHYRGHIIPTIDVFFSAQTKSFDVVLQAGEITNWHLLHRNEIQMEDIAFESMRVALSLYWKSPDASFQ